MTTESRSPASTGPLADDDETVEHRVPAPVSTAALDERYGRTRPARIRQRWLYGTAGGLVALVFGAWVLWAGLDQASGSIDATDRAFDVVDARTIDVTFSVVMPAGQEAWCAVQAQDEQRSVVGWKVVELPAQDGVERTETVRLRTTGQAVTGLIHSCWPA
ncbi:DUF4307 domain-containing protein [Clavibacter michiganensis]|uniref:DUF4307 domain-containing protein n=1 Tax=Clavibacter michiganensis TaxID=28447 RepID=UPI001BE0A6FF|nr:DUF4307 domain-containing protein [Clavibacter michiganensis]MBT1636364.1 DUF4307 domain-containing protein [Clavibacter michiganensis]